MTPRAPVGLNEGQRRVRFSCREESRVPRNPQKAPEAAPGLWQSGDRGAGVRRQSPHTFQDLVVVLALLWHLKLPRPKETVPDSEGLLLPGRLKGVLSLFSKECSALQDFPPSQSHPFIGSAKIIWGSHRPFCTKSCEEDHGEIPDPQMHTRQMVPSRSILKPQLISLYVWASDVVLNTGLTPSGWAREVGHEQRVLTPHWP